jgi:hypothetical protein
MEAKEILPKSTRSKSLVFLRKQRVLYKGYPCIVYEGWHGESIADYPVTIGPIENGDDIGNGPGGPIILQANDIDLFAAAREERLTNEQPVKISGLTPEEEEQNAKQNNLSGVRIKRAFLHFVNQELLMPLQGAFPSNRALQMSVNKVGLARMWMGKILEYSGEGSPYVADTERKKAEQIKPTADTPTDMYLSVWRESYKVELWRRYFIMEGKSDPNKLTEEVSMLREAMEAILADLDRMLQLAAFEVAVKKSMAISAAWVNLSEAKMTLGMFLGQIKKMIDENKIH